MSNVVEDAAGADVLSVLCAVVNDGGCVVGAVYMGCGGEEHAGLLRGCFQAQGSFESKPNNLLTHSASPSP